MKRLLFCFAFLPMLIYSQSKTITGTVNDKTGIPLPGVSILVKNSINIGATTDFDGNFSITIPPNKLKTLVFSYIGYGTQEVNVANSNNLNIIMLTDQTQLDEVVVIGYGSVLKKDMTGAVSSIKIDEVTANQSNSIENLLQGRAAGVQVVQNSGAPGSGISVKIRGTNSLRGNNEPLYVIDGVIISSAGEDTASAATGNSGQESQNGLNGINARDIESIQVLKDASATAIYGSRGANGVILISTKKGISGKVKINTFINTSIRSITKQYEVLDGFGFANYVNELNELNGDNPRYSIDGSSIYPITYDVDDNPTVSTIPGEIHNWQDEMYRTSYSTKVGASASGGGDNGNYYISAGFDDQKGVVQNSSFKSGDFRINLNQDLNDNLKLEARVSAMISSSDFADGGHLFGDANSSAVQSFITFSPIITSDIEDLENIDDDLDLSNPYAWIDDFSDVSDENRYIGSLGLTYKLPVKGLSYQIKAGGNIRTKDRRRFFGLSTWQGKNGNGALQLSTLNSSTYQINNFLRFNRTFNGKHRINSLFGATYDVRNVSKSVYAVEDFITTQFQTEQPAFGQVITLPLTFLKSDQQIFSLLGRVNYTYDNRYTLTATFRRDGVSKFSEDQQFGFFPSFAMAWNVGNEKWMKNLEFFEELKFRAGWGQIGNHGISPYSTLSNYGADGLYGNASGGTNVAIALQNIANPDLTWETTEQLNLGFDFGTKNNAVSGSIDVYDKTTKDLLQRSNIPTSSGFSSILINRGEISNKGLEVALNFMLVSTNDFEMSIGGNIAFNKTKITDLSAQPLSDLYINGEAQQRRFYFGNAPSRANTGKYPFNVFVEGEETSLFYGWETNGIYQTDDTDIPLINNAQAVPGDVRIVDQNGDGIIDLNDRTFIGNPNPDFVYGVNFNLRYKGLTASMLFNGVQGNDIANGTSLRVDYANDITWSNVLASAYNNAWRPDNPSNTNPRLGYDTAGQPALLDRIIEDGSYLRLSNLTIGYDIPVDDIKLLDRVNLFIAGNNLITWTDYSGYNPEITSFLYTGLINGVDWNGGPNARTFTLGLNLSF